MEITKILVDSFVKENGTKAIDAEVFKQANPLAFKAINAVFTDYATFMLAVSKKAVPAPKVTSSAAPKKVTK